MVNATACSRGGWWWGDDDWEPPESNRWSAWLFWTGWGALVGGLVFLLDGSWLAGGLWLAGGISLGAIFTLLWDRFMEVTIDWCTDLCRDEREQQEEGRYASRLFESLQQKHILGELPEDLDEESSDKRTEIGSHFEMRAIGIIPAMLAVPFIYSFWLGALLAPLAGIAAYALAEVPGTATTTALLMFVIVAPMVAFGLSLTLFAWSLSGWGLPRPVRAWHRWLLLVSPLLAVPLLYQWGKSLLTWPAERRAIEQLSKRGAKFRGRPGSGVRWVRLRGEDFNNDDVHRLSLLRNLRVVDLAGTSIDDLVVPVLARMPSIELLDLRRTNVTGRAIEKLRRSLPGCLIFPWR